MCIHRWRWIVAALISAMFLAGSPLRAEPVALPGLNAAIGDSSISGISSGAFMAVQFGTAWSSVIGVSAWSPAVPIGAPRPIWMTPCSGFRARSCAPPAPA